MTTSLLYPTKLVWGQMQSGWELKAFYQVLRHEVLLASVVHDESGHFMLNMEIMGKHGNDIGVWFISCH